MKLNKENKLLLTLSLACALAVIVMIISLCIPKKAEPKPFEPPTFDINAIDGEPTVPDNLGYSILYREGMSFKVGICGKIILKNNSADIYLTNVADNNVWLKVRFYDKSGQIIGESGLVKPREYIKSISFDNAISTTEGITLKVMSYEPETYRSAGAITLTPKVISIEE